MKPKLCRNCGKQIPKDAPFYTTRAYCSRPCAKEAAERRELANRLKKK